MRANNTAKQGRELEPFVTEKFCVACKLTGLLTMDNGHVSPFQNEFHTLLTEKKKSIHG